MKLPAESKFRRWRFCEIARYVPDLDRVIRIQEGTGRVKAPVLLEWGDDVERFRTENNNRGLYTSVFHYDSRDLDTATRLGSLYFDLDSSDGGVAAQEESIRLANYLLQYVPESALRVYFTGKKGFHVEAEALALGVGPANDLPGLFRYIATRVRDELELRTIDFAVYDLRRMWRLPNSQHQTTGLFKVELDLDLLASTIEAIYQYAAEPKFDRDVPDQVFNARANEWYRSWQYQKETKTLDHNDMIERFAKFGSGLVFKEDPNTEIVFDPLALFENCPAMMRLWEQAERDHDLSHEARLFLCSLLTYTEESEWYLHQILQNCEDYNPEKSQAHINDWKKRRELGIGGRPFSCERANQAGVGCGSCDLAPREKLERIGDRLVKTGAEASPSPIRFAYRRRPRRQEE